MHSLESLCRDQYKIFMFLHNDSFTTLTFLLRVLIMNSLARCVAGCGSSGRITILLSNGSPGTIYVYKINILKHDSNTRSLPISIVTLLQ